MVPSSALNPQSKVAAGDAEVITKKGLIDLTYLAGLTNHDNASMMQLINVYMEQTPSLVNMMKKGLEDKDWDLVQRAAHKLIPSFSIMGIDRSYEIMAKKIEEYAREKVQPEEIEQLVPELAAACMNACSELKEACTTLEDKGLVQDRQIKLFLVDDDALFLRTLELEMLQHANFVIETYSTGELCLKNISHNPDIIILDHYLDSVEKNAMTGIEILDRIKAFNSNIPVVMLSAQDKIEVAVEYMHHGAYDYVVKSETAFMRLQKIISNIFSYKKMQNKLNWYMDRM